MRPKKGVVDPCRACAGTGVRIYRVKPKPRVENALTIAKGEKRGESVCDMCGGSGQTHWMEKETSSQVDLRDLGLDNIRLDDTDSW